jgi:hypothetical protein
MERLYTVEVSVPGWGHKTYQAAGVNNIYASVAARRMAEADTGVDAYTVAVRNIYRTTASFEPAELAE